MLREGRAVRHTPVRIRFMSRSAERHVYGPVPSRRLGRSLGIDLVPFKTCSYDCVYCQLGRTTRKTVERWEYIAPERIFADLESKLASVSGLDYIGLAGSGEPTLHARLGEVIRGIKERTATPVAVLTNGSLLWNREVQDALRDADVVMPSLDAGDARLFAYVNRPHRALDFERVVNGLVEFRARFLKPVWLEVFLLGGVTGLGAEVEKIAALCRVIRPDRIQLNTVLRPPAEDFAFPVSPELMASFASLFDPPAEVIAGPPDVSAAAFETVLVPDEEILALLSRRPSTAPGVSSGLGIHVSEAIKRLEALAARGALRTTVRRGARFYEVVRTA
jgi:wyosine [tRNA(Phe)-imidazoG37] synthetase (radical SAM superfamily)